tara:strand:- start:1657 stop:1842 length:186 start_codon:yes stop_codon:yes gene_type:complete
MTDKLCQGEKEPVSLINACRYGIRVHKHNELIDKKINTVIVFSDEYFNEIQKEAFATFKDI